MHTSTPHFFYIVNVSIIRAAAHCKLLALYNGNSKSLKKIVGFFQQCPSFLLKRSYGKIFGFCKYPLLWLNQCLFILLYTDRNILLQKKITPLSLPVKVV